jgi:excinuclease ABC subunit A
MIRLRGVRQHNLKNFDLDLPLGRLIVVTGLSGSGKSSLAFDTLFAEGQRRYIETFSPYARQFFDRMDKPQVDSIEGIPPAIAIEQRNTVRTTRSTVGTMTEIADYLKVIWPHLAQLHCRACDRVVQKEAPQQIWEKLTELAATDPILADAEFVIAFELPLSEKLDWAESLALVGKQGYQWLAVGRDLVRLETVSEKLFRERPAQLIVVQDRLRLLSSQRSRFVEACEQAYRFGKGKLAIYRIDPSAPRVLAPFEPRERERRPRYFSNRYHCADCQLDYRPPTPALFSFNHPLGACPTCRGFGRTVTIDYNLAVPDRSKTLAGGLVRPWQSGVSAECQEDLLEFCSKRGVPTDVPFVDLPQHWQDWVMQGDPGYGRDKQHEWPHAWYGVAGYFRWLESKSYKMHVRGLLSRYRAYQTCPDCQGKRFQPDALFHRIPVDPPSRDAGNRAARLHSAAPSFPSSGMTLADFNQLPVQESLGVVERLRERHGKGRLDPVGLALDEIRARLGFLVEVGLGYLTLDRPTRSLSGGETERVNLTRCLGTRLVNTLYVLDEPTVGLHPRDTDRLVRILQRLRDAENTVLVVEHEASVMRAADQVIDLGPGHGESGGQVVFQGGFRELLECRDSLTGRYLSGRQPSERPPRRPVTLPPFSEGAKQNRDRRVGADAGVGSTGESNRPGFVGCLELTHAHCHNLVDFSVRIPLGRLVCITGVSGSGKTTLVREVMLPMLEGRLASANAAATEAEGAGEPSGEGEESRPVAGAASAGLRGWETLGRVVMVDQTSLGKTPRSNPAVYIGAFEDIRTFFAQGDAAHQRGLSASAFSFNSAQGQCQRCRGAGFEKIEMQFLSDVYIRCPDCNGRRYRAHILEVKIESPAGNRSWSIADLLEATVDEVIEFLSPFAAERAVRNASNRLKLLQEVGLGYLRLGQPINTLSGGESQRLKLVSHLAEEVDRMTASGAARPDAEWAAADDRGSSQRRSVRSGKSASGASPEFKPTLFLFDEPTTGLHFEDVRILLRVLHRLVEGGHTVLVVEHNLAVIQSADWVIDLGPEAGEKGGAIVAEGHPEEIGDCPASHTGRFLRAEFSRAGAVLSPEGRLAVRKRGLPASIS